MSGASGPSYEFGPFRLDLSEVRLTRQGKPVPLTPKAFELLRVLVEHHGHLVDKETLVAAVWPDNFVEEGALNRNISVVRKALGETLEQRYIETVPKRGYRFVAPVVERLEGPSRAAAVATRTSRIARVAISLTGLFLIAVFARVVLRQSETSETGFHLNTEHKQVTFTGKEGTPTVSPDGRRIAYVSHESPLKKVMVQELSGGSPVEILSAPEAGHLRWSPDGADLLVWARGAAYNGIYIVPQMGGTPRLVARRMFIACWSPDGSTIAVPSYLGGKISFVDTQGTPRRTVSLKDVAWSIWDIDWSPASNLIMFTSSDYQGRFTLWTVRPDGEEQTQILSQPGGIYSARWAPGGDSIYYLRQLNQTDSLFRINVRSRLAANGNESASLLTGLETDQSFAISSDGRRLVYARSPYHSNLSVLDIDAGGRWSTKELTRGTSLIERPHVSPDGQSVLFNMGHEPTANVYTMPLAGGSPKQLTFFDSFNVAGGWSADGNSIAFASTQGGKARVWTVTADGTGLHPLSSSEMSDSYQVSWSPGGAILYHKAGNRNYFQLDAETGQEQPLVLDDAGGWMFSPAPAPDGRRVAVMWNRPPKRGIWVIEPAVHRETFIRKTDATRTAPFGWSADGLSIYAIQGKPLTSRGLTAFLGETLTEAKILRISLRGNAETIATLPSNEVGGITMTADGRRFVYTSYSSRSDVWIVDNFDAAPRQQLTRKN